MPRVLHITKHVFQYPRWPFWSPLLFTGSTLYWHARTYYVCVKVRYCPLLSVYRVVTSGHADTAKRMLIPIATRPSRIKTVNNIRNLINHCILPTDTLWPVRVDTVTEIISQPSLHFNDDVTSTFLPFQARWRYLHVLRNDRKTNSWPFTAAITSIKTYIALTPIIYRMTSRSAVD